MRNSCLSVVLPVYNERENLQPLWEELRGELERSGRPFEVIFVNDGSEDGSDGVLDRLAESDHRVKILHFESNAGQTAALDAGFRAACGEIVVTLDSDLQNDPADIPLLLERIGSLDAVVGYRVDRRDPWSRRVSSRIANAVRNLVSEERIADTGCSLKAFRRECLSRLQLYDGMHRFLPTLLRMEGLVVEEIPVRHRPRRWGTSKYGLLTRLVSACCDLLVVRWMKKRRLDYRLRGKVEAIKGRERSTRVG